MMHMTFYWGTKVTVLFDFWSTESILAYSLTLLVCLLFSAFYQCLEARRLKLLLISQSFPSSSDPPIQTPLLIGPLSQPPWLFRAAGSLLFALNSALGYMLMLAVMSFNWGVFIAVVVGLSLGYCFFRIPSPPPPRPAPCTCDSCLGVMSSSSL